MNEQEQKNKTGSFFKRATSKGKEALKKKAKNKIRMIIMAVLAKLLVFVLIFWAIILLAIIIASIIEFITGDSGSGVNKAKAGTISSTYTGEEGNTEQGEGINTKKITLKPRSDGKGFEFVYDYDEDELQKIERKLQRQVEMKSGDFSELELAILGAIIDGSDETVFQGFTKKELHCITPFLKAEACTQNLDLRPNSEKIVNGEYVPEQLTKDEMEKENKIPGTILLQRTNTKDQNATENYTPEILEYVEKEKFEQLKSDVALDGERKTRNIKVFYNK